jgi:demethylmenaquinone methyltransferase/2-methoxy-6-polyprenyl-1,4-benzoquinol methylase
MMPAPSTARPEAGSDKRSYVRGMFSAIAPRYDFLNHLLSLNFDRHWRRRAVERLAWRGAPGGRYLDVCAGTLDLAMALRRCDGFHGQVVGVDFALPMLHWGRRKAPEVRVVAADAERLPFGDATFDGCMVAFGVRNLADPDRGLGEMARVLKPGASLVILEFALPAAWPVRPVYLWYFRHVLPRIGRIVSKHTSAYQYLPDSVSQFLDPVALSRRIASSGFGEVGFESLTFGVAALHWGRRR